MAPYYWKGYLKLSLVTCPVAMTPATSESEKVRFHTLNKATGNRVVSRYVDSVTGKPVKDENEAKGYARGENDYVILTEDDLDRVALDTVKTIDIEKFVPADSIEWTYLEKPHYLMPDDPVGNEAFAVIRDAMKADQVFGVSKLVMGRRERAVILEPRDEGIVLWSLRFGDEVRPEDSYFEDIDEDADPDLVPLVEKLIKRKSAHWSPEMASDPIQTSLLKLIDEKRKALKPRKAVKGKAPGIAPSSNVVNIMDALRKSLEADLKGRKAG
ncbi:non-homologous end joining protein Ku [Rhizobium anhuiense]|uniref:Non-homologous end joining protein Ku n=1 Tax=Rhizobium anhuiense TaxID=1184720 RepID=A0A432NA83_9HYPH|nr:Ku protein [Rhizobium anhuiense]RUL96452.1 Ku protein [Rhizobium anhuiense]GGE07901.1 non-homologous end joining protein Ku [Rhizobium anhuiense]